MKERQSRQIETLRAIVVRFLTVHLFTNARVLHLKAEILAHYERITKLASENHKFKAEPSVQRHAERLTKDGLREDQLLPLSRRGRKLVRLYPELKPALKVPHKNASVAATADAAERMADALTPHLHVLIKAKFPRNCLDTLRQDARALRAHADAVQRSRTLLGRSNRELTEELSLVRNAIDELDAVLRSLDDYSSYKSVWEGCKRVSGRLGRPTKRRLAARARSAARSRARADQRPSAALD